MESTSRFSSLSPGTHLLFHNLCVKVSHKEIRYVHITPQTTACRDKSKITSPTLLPICNVIYPFTEVPNGPFLSLDNNSYQTCSVLGRCENILSFTSAPCHPRGANQNANSNQSSISCKLEISDISGACEVYIDQPYLIRTLFSLTDSEYQLLCNTSLTYGLQHKSPYSPSPQIEVILTRPFKHCQSVLVQGKVHRRQCYVVESALGSHLKHAGVTLYPLVLSLVSVKDLISKY